MNKLSKEYIDRVRKACDIVKIIGLSVDLVKEDNGIFAGESCFHPGKIKVSKEKQSFFDYGIRQGGDVFKFVMIMDDCTFTQAVKKIANDVGIKL